MQQQLEAKTPYKRLIAGPPIESSGANIEYISGTAAAKMLGITKPTLIKEANEGHINAHLRRGRYLFTRADIQEYIFKNMTCRTAVVKKLNL
jgi:excisionase family DNA binding protein